jgi:PAS domain-containing protein
MEDQAPAAPVALSERVPPSETERLAALLQRSPVLAELLNAVPGFFMILNRTRQIVFANRSLRRLLEPQGRHCAVGLRPGEALACVNSAAAPGGCGLSDRCVDCGALGAILSCQRDSPAVEECRLIRGGSREAMDLRVLTTPVHHEGESLVVLAAEDISSEKRRESLERCFMHDVANTVSGILCAAELLRGGLSGKAEEAAEAVLRGSRHLLV